MATLRTSRDCRALGVEPVVEAVADLPHVAADVVGRVELDDLIVHVDGGAPPDREDRLDHVLDLGRVRLPALNIRLKTGPVTVELKSKKPRQIDSPTCWPLTRLSVQYVPRHATAEFSVRNGHFVNGMRSVGVTSSRVSP